MSVLRKVLRWTAAGLTCALLLVSALALWIVNTQRGTAWIAGVIGRTLENRVSFDGVQGVLAGPLTLQHVHYSDPATGLTVSVERVTTDVEWRALARGLIHVRNAEVLGIDVILGKPQPEEPGAKPFSLELPIDIILNRFTLHDAVISRAGERIVVVNEAEASGSWMDAGIAIEQLDVLSPEGEAHFAGRVSHARWYTGSGHGEFRWRAGELTYAGSLTTEARDSQARIVLGLRSPLDARLNASVAQTDAMPWRFALEVPRFDPREALLPDSQMQVLAASLRGEGSLNKGEVRGEVIVNDIPIRIDPLQFVRGKDRIVLDPLRVRVGDGNGALEAKGELLTMQDPLRARLDMIWRDLKIPARLAGQELHTDGKLRFAGSAESFATAGQLSIGPPQDPVDISLDVEGTPQAIDIKRLALVQESGELTAQGTVELKPHIAWRLQSQARQFNPGALAAQWPGRMNFSLSTRGRLDEAGPDGALELRNLHGRLRGRPIAGHADLRLTPHPTLAGTLALQSGNSRIDVLGKGGEAMHATATIDVRNLGDWVPDAEGGLRALITAQGRLPKLDIKARANGKKLRVADARVDAVRMDVRIVNPRQPSGSAHVDFEGVAAAGFEFDTVRADARGDQNAHTIGLTAKGDRLSGELRVSGSQGGGGWSGSIEQLLLDVPKFARLELESPARVAASKDSVTLQQTCLRGGDLRLCAAFDKHSDGTIEASYLLHGMQLALANAFVPDLPVTVSGTVEGEGKISRTPAGEIYGAAHIALPGGRIAATQTPEESLMQYSDLRVAADLAGRDVRATLSGRFGDGGQLNGNASLVGLGQARTTIDGHVSASIPSLAPIALFVPQLAEVAGRADMRATVRGALGSPEISGELRATDLAAQVPELGLKLTAGSVRATPETSGNIAVSGEVQSGRGKLSLHGFMTRDGHVHATVKGQDFLAAEIPAAHVIAAPQLEFTRDAQRMSLTGEVHIPSASIDLTKLPAGGPQRASPDVVVIDEVSRQDDAQGMPLHTNVTVKLGEDVKLAGFGLQAKIGGQLRIKETPGSPALGTGDISVAGTYKAYGQDLTIQRGQLLFAGTPLDNPGLSIVAIRKAQDAAAHEVTAGLRITGTAKSPQVTVFSEPSMSQSEALSYLVTGKPLDSIGSGEGDALQAAARSLGTAGGGLLAKSIGAHLGVDEVGVENNELIGGAAFTMGEYLSPRLYLSYGVGLFEPGEVISLRYRLSRKLSLQTAHGPHEMRAGLEYRVEK